ncbi:MAG: hypothetical protein PHE68_02015 [Candidatus Peribacteraceae bacterium]|nr:hypothetical protein [Candidatus Peribacteraceae bacterium]MDD5074460.1 hypothetical protein [Candidatus Peribacteraceae bacterium]
MRFPTRTLMIGALLLIPTLTHAKTFVVPHVLERSGISAPSQSTMPTAQELQQTIEKRTGITGIKWNQATGKSGRHVKLTGTGTMGDNLSVNISCTVSYPPLSIRCTITASL